MPFIYLGNPPVIDVLFASDRPTTGALALPTAKGATTERSGGEPDARGLQAAAETASRRLGCTRMWSIHPSQIRPIVEAFSPTVAELDQAIEIIVAAQAAQWAPIRHKDSLHDRASYRYFWQVIERAHRTSPTAGLPAQLRLAWFGPGRP